jgi:hypothetical protein
MGSSVEFVLDGLNRPSSDHCCRMQGAAIGQLKQEYFPQPAPDAIYAYAHGTALSRSAA